MNEYTAILKKSGAWWIGWIAEVPGVNCQERTREALIDTLRATLKEALEFNRQDARAAAGRAYEEEPIGEWQRPDMSANDMKKPSSPKRSEDLRPEYGAEFFRRLRRNRFASQMEGQVVVVVLDPDVAEVFGSSEAVNSFLRSAIAARPKRRPKKAGRKKRAV